MADQVDEVKSKVDIVSIIGERVQLSKAGRNYKALCPFHSEKTPSFMVSPELQIFKCFGCSESGDAFSFLEKYEGMDFPEALKYLADRVGIKLIPREGRRASEKERLMEINREAVRFYHYLLLNHPAGKKALDYLVGERGLKVETIKEFNLGFSPDNPLALKKFLVDKKKFSPRELDAAGIAVVRGQEVFDRLRGRVIFPLFDHRGNPVGFAGRLLPGAKSDLAKYVNTPETAIYHKGSLLYGLNLTRAAVKAKGIAIVVEGELDLISSWQIGIKNVVAIKGSALTDDQVQLLSRFAQKLILALDADLAGDAAARRGIAVAFNQGLEIKVARMGNFKDPDEAARKSPEEYKNALIKAVPVWDFLIDMIFKKYEVATGEGKAKISREIIPILKSIEDSIVLEHYASLVAKKLGVSVDSVTEQMGKEKETFLEGKSKSLELAEVTEEKGRRQLLEERLLTLAFQSNPKILLEAPVVALLSTPLAKRLVEEYAKFTKEGNTPFSPSAFSNYIPPELFNGFSQMVLKDLDGLAEDEEVVEREIGMVKHELEILDTRYKLEVVSSKIHKFESSSEADKLKEAQIEFGKLSEKLAKLEEGGQGVIILKEV
jgi:DNA primase